MKLIVINYENEHNAQGIEMGNSLHINIGVANRSHTYVIYSVLSYNATNDCRSSNDNPIM